VVSIDLALSASRSACAMTFASRKSRIGAPLSHRRTEEIGACLADPSANGEGARMKDTFTIPEGRRRRVYRPWAPSLRRRPRSVNRHWRMSGRSGRRSSVLISSSWRSPSTCRTAARGAAVLLGSGMHRRPAVLLMGEARMWRTRRVLLALSIALFFYIALLFSAKAAMRIFSESGDHNLGRTWFVAIMAFAVLPWSGFFYALRRLNRVLYGMIELLVTLGLGAVFFLGFAKREFREVPLSDWLAIVEALHSSLIIAGAVYVGVRALDNIGEGLKPGTCRRAAWDKVFPKP
jgi:hypothetical protein